MERPTLPILREEKFLRLLTRKSLISYSVSESKCAGEIASDLLVCPPSFGPHLLREQLVRILRDCRIGR